MYGLFFGTNNGEIHLLLFPSFFDENPPATGWGDGSDVTGTFKSKEFNFGDWDTSKIIRKIYTSMTATDVDMTLYARDTDDVVNSVTLKTNATLPGVDNATPDISNLPRRIRGAAIQISGIDLVLESLDFMWRQLRME